MIKKAGHIIRGWAKALGWVQTSVAEKKLSELRLQICKGCDYSKMSKWLDLVNEEEVEIAGLVCTECGCPCLEKSLVIDETCPEKFW